VFVHDVCLCVLFHRADTFVVICSDFASDVDSDDRVESVLGSRYIPGRLVQYLPSHAEAVVSVYDWLSGGAILATVPASCVRPVTAVFGESLSGGMDAVSVVCLRLACRSFMMKRLVRSSCALCTR
jgi:hypothetical protein